MQSTTGVRIRKALILAAGYGTRFLPATKAVPKEMLPILDRPVIQYIVEEALAAGLDQIVIVTAMGKRAIEDHFDRNADLETALERKPDYLEDVRRVSGIDIAFIRQKEMKGQSHAILGTRRFIGDEPFALFYPDDVIFSDRPAIGQLLDVQARHGGSVIAVQRVGPEDIVHYGAIDAEPVEDRVWRVRSIVEKPRAQDAPSNLGTVGRFALAADIWPLLEKTPPSLNGEMFFTDTMTMLMKQGGEIFACEYEGERFDTGRPLGLLKASIYTALRRPDVAPELLEYLRSLNVPA
ncbi:MAG: UTP--glucose-1-phosphate uridylyltransferase [Dehalococcoidia bacterium]